jgi:flagellar biosynthetic protein FliR
MTLLGAFSEGALPGVNIQGLYDLVVQLMILSLRIGSFLLSAPFFGARSVVVTVRIVATCAITFSLMDRVAVPQLGAMSDLSIVSVIMKEILIGLCAGMTMTVLFSSVALAGEKISATSGLSFATQIDPSSGGATPVVAQILSMFLTAIFLSLNGHLIALVTIIQSYDALPIGAKVNFVALFDAGSWAMHDMLVSATKIMLPIVALMTFINIAIGITTRSAPTLNLFSFGFPITLIAVFLLLFLSVPHFAAAFADLTEQILSGLKTLLREAEGG